MGFDFALSSYRFLTSQTFSGFLFSLMFLWFAFSMFHRVTIKPAQSRQLFRWYLVITLVQLVLLSADLWWEWHKESCGLACQFFFPPYSNYYLNQVLIKWSASLAFNASVGLIGGLVFLWFSKKTNGRIIDQVDVDLLTVGGMVAGWPNILIFYGMVFVATILGSVVRAISEKSTSIRMIITPFLPFACTAVALFGDQIAHWLRLFEIGITVL